MVSISLSLLPLVVFIQTCLIPTRMLFNSINGFICCSYSYGRRDGGKRKRSYPPFCMTGRRNREGKTKSKGTGSIGYLPTTAHFLETAGIN